MHEEPLIDERVSRYAEEHNIDADKLDWHLEAIHGWEPHNRGYEEAIEAAAECMTHGFCE